MKITFNPSTVAALTSPPNNKDITFDLKGHNIFARGVEFKGTDTNTWRDIKINNVSIGSNILDLCNGTNTTLTNINGVVTINSTWRPIVDNLTSNSTTSSLSANQGRVLKALIDGKSDSGHNHDDRYLRLIGGTLSGALSIITPSFGALIIQRNDTTNGASIQFKGSSSIYGYIGFNKDSKDKQLLRWNSSANTTFSILDTSTTYVSSNKGYINGTEITQVNNANKWTTARTFTIGNTSKNVDGSNNVSWSLSEIGAASSGHNHDERYVRAFGTSDDNIDSDWGQSFKTFDPIPSGTPPEKNPNISLLSIGAHFFRRKQLAFVYDSDNIYYRRHLSEGFTNWKRIAFANEIPSSLKNPHALTISLNGTSQGPYDGSVAMNINITPGSIGAATSDHNHDDRYLRLIGGTLSGALSIITPSFGALIIQRNDTTNGASIQFKGSSSIYGYIGFNKDSKDKQLLRWNSSANTTFSILDTSTTYVSSNKGYINGTEITYVNTAQYLRSLGNQNCQTGRTQAYGGVYTYNTYNGNTGSPTSNTSVIGFGRGTSGTVEIAGGWCNTNLYWRSLRDCCDNWYSWRTVLDSNNYTEFIGNYYWANVKISTSANTQTTPSVNTIFANDWFRSRGDTGWYNESYGGGIRMTDTEWIRTFGGKSFYCDSQISSYGYHHLDHDINDAVLLAGGDWRLDNIQFKQDSFGESYSNNHPTAQNIKKYSIYQLKGDRTLHLPRPTIDLMGTIVFVKSSYGSDAKVSGIITPCSKYIANYTNTEITRNIGANSMFYICMNYEAYYSWVEFYCG